MDELPIPIEYAGVVDDIFGHKMRRVPVLYVPHVGSALTPCANMIEAKSPVVPVNARPPARLRDALGAPEPLMFGVAFVIVTILLLPNVVAVFVILSVSMDPL